MKKKTACIISILLFAIFFYVNADPDDDFYFFEEFFIQEDIMTFMMDDSYDEVLDYEDSFFYYDDIYDEDFPDEEFYVDDFPLDAPTLIYEAPVFQMRSFDDIFPFFPDIWMPLVMSETGLRHSFSVDEFPLLYHNPDLGIDLLSSVIETDPSHLIEALLLIPYNEREYDLLDIFNALGRIESIKDYPAIFSNNEVYIFSDSHRIESPENRRAIADPPPSTWLPASQTMYLRLREIYIGNLFLRGDISIDMYSITYSMTNFIDVRYFFIPIVRAERFAALIYLEPVKEGMLIYSVSGFYLPSFFADRMNLTPNINRRIEVFIRWITDGLRMQSHD